MKLSTHLVFNCRREAAFKLRERCLGGKRLTMACIKLVGSAAARLVRKISGNLHAVFRYSSNRSNSH
jgi:hypothetical protein